MKNTTLFLLAFVFISFLLFFLNVNVFHPSSSGNHQGRSSVPIIQQQPNLSSIQAQIDQLTKSVIALEKAVATQQQIESSIPEIKPAIPEIESSIPEIKPAIPEFESSIPEIPPDEPDPTLNATFWSIRNCSYTVVFQMYSGGFTVRYRCLISTVLYALRFNRTFALHYYDLIWDKGGSSFGNWTQFFKPIPSQTFCPDSQRYIPDLHKHLHVDEGSEKAPHTYDTVGHCMGERIPQIPELTMHMASKLVWQFNSETKREIEKILSVFPNWDSSKYIAIHVRRGDKNFGKSKEAQYLPTTKYIEFVENQLGGTVEVPVFIASESESNILEFKSLRPNWEIWSIRNQEFRDMRAGNYSTDEFDLKPYEFRTKFFLYFLAEITMMKYANRLFCTRSSNVCALLGILRPNPETLNHIKEWW